ncbi:uncharacterized protein LOC110250955 [Exaiptasia diaphana]|uniref:Uncharacterized protein n=1 Tax=Exaiptasia diaphana TaxID=2652724 RepID=A0A913Y2Y5_EXADI|nr:uncharacterized protein LOC110250512 [Exaiptasia diaphana]XP_020913278.1 uncharacterized protein LOC110250955 [Exaiptasia diaphana]
MSAQGKGNISSDVRMGSARKDSDTLSTGSLLLSFMTQASGNVKTALEKPANFKRNINHRRYLQKQLRNYSKKKGDTPAKKTSSSSTKFKSTHGHSGKQSYKSQSVSYMKSLRDSWLGSEKERNALKERNLPASFWQEPIIPSFQQDINSSMYQYHPRPEDYAHTNAGPNQEIETYLSGWNNAVATYDATPRTAGEFPTSDAIPSITPEDGLSEEFMTGEELTRNLDIKDLYVPEMYSADKLLSDVQETLFAGQISPSQYYLPSPSPYNTEAYFNFSLEHDPQGLPPIAMAFFGQNPLAQC